MNSPRNSQQVQERELRGKGKYLDHIRREGDRQVTRDDVKKGDIIIPVMGPTGAGKSTFIRNILQSQMAAGGFIDDSPLPDVSSGFKSCTVNVQHYYSLESVQLASDSVAKTRRGEIRRLVLVDTPGFDDTEVSDTEILRRISVWLASAYHLGMTVAAVVYLYPIFPNRMTRNDRSNLEVFKKICGENAHRKIVLATTNWSLLPPESEIGQSREQELVNEYWKEMVTNGTKVARLEDSPESARAIIQGIIERHFEDLRAQDRLKNEALDLTVQLQIMMRGKKIPATAAGKELRRKLLTLLKEHETASTAAEAKQKFEALTEQIAGLRVGFLERLAGLFGR